MTLRHAPLDSSWKQRLRDILVHTVDVEPRLRLDERSNPVYGTKIVGVKCWATDSKRRLRTAENEEIAVDNEVWFDPCHKDLVVVGTRLTNVRDRQGQVLIGAAIILSEDGGESPQHGRVEIVTYCKLE